ncbi:MAG: ROK family transcriptional regulator [Brachybacterium sp.]|nr:ROK family transcriptional regulator [Brachybacterium sp.]
MRKGASRTVVRQHNERAIIHALRRHGPSSQSEMAERSGLSVPAVSSIVRTLTAEGYLHEIRSESSGVGRPRAIVGIVPDAAFSVGVHIDPALMSVVLLDLGGNVVEVRYSSEVHQESPDATLDIAAGLVAEVTAIATTQDRVAGAGLAVPGRISQDTGSIVDSVWLPAWNGTPLRDGLAARIGLDVRFLKDTHAAVTGELWVRGRHLLEGTVVYVYLGIGTGFGIAVDGDVVTGLSGNAGQVGRIFEELVHRPSQEPDVLAPSGGVDSSHGPTAQDPVELVATAHRLGVLQGTPPPRSDLAAIDRAFRELCARDDGKALLSGAADRIARAAAIASDLLDAQYLVIGGPYEALVGSQYRARATAVLGGSDSMDTPGITLLASALGSDASAIGAASAVWDDELVPRAPAPRRRSPARDDAHTG